MATISKGTGTFALAAFDNDAVLRKHEFGRPAPGPNDVAIDIKYCGMCHSDLHAVNGDWGINKHPMAPGHEVAGVVTSVGNMVQKFKVGDRVGVGCMVESCRSCSLCDCGMENHCPQMIQTYGSVYPKDNHSGSTFEQAVDYHTNGGYSTDITVNEHFVFTIPDKIGLEYAGPLLCAGVTTFSPLNKHILKKGGGAGKRVGIVGFGGLGHMAAKLAKAMGAEVVILSRSTAKEAEAQALGASILVHSDEAQVQANTRTCDVILDTVSASHPIAPLMNMLKVGASYVLLGAIGQPFEISAFPMIFSNQSLEGSLIGGVPETQEMLDFCAEHDVKPDIDIIHARDANAQFRAMAEGSASASRKVIDMSTLADLEEESTSRVV